MHQGTLNLLVVNTEELSYRTDQVECRGVVWSEGRNNRFKALMISYSARAPPPSGEVFKNALGRVDHRPHRLVQLLRVAISL